MQSRLDRVETALDALIDSIASYIPSTNAASDLLEADDELNYSVDQCKLLVVNRVEQSRAETPSTVTLHQEYYARILRLRETVDNLNHRITASLSSLAAIRKDLLATPATVFSQDQRKVPYAELLDYASRINKYTIPPTLRQPGPILQPEDTTQMPQQPPNPLPSNGSGISAEQNFPSPVVSSLNTQAHGEGIGVLSLDQKEVQWLDPLSTQIPFVPWPSEDVIRRGALAQIQLLLEQGQDPNNAVTSIAGEETEPAPASADAIVVDQPEGVRAADLETPVGRVPQVERIREEKPKVFAGLDLYDPDEEL